MAIYKLGEISEITVGKTPSTQQEIFWTSEDIRWYTGANMTAKSHECKKVSNEAIIQNKQPITTENSILFSMVRYIEPLIPIVGSTFNQQIACINPNSLLDNKYLYYWLEKNKDKIKKEGISGSTFPKINSTDIKNIKIDVPSIEIQQEIIDIIKPIATHISLVHKMQKQIQKVILSIPETESKFTLSDVALINRTKSKNTTQLSAKVLNYRNPVIKNFEDPNTYKSNTYFALENSLLVNTIRPKLNKYCIVPSDTDYNGTLINYNVLKNHTAILKALSSDYFWDQCILYSKGTKMPIISKDDLSNRILMNTLEYEIPNIFNLLSRLNILEIKLNNLRNETIKLLIK